MLKIKSGNQYPLIEEGQTTRKSKDKGQKTKDKRTNNDQQIITQRTKDQQHDAKKNWGCVSFLN